MFLETQFKNGSQSDNKPETYELLEGGWIEKATEFLGIGHWAIGRPKSVTHSNAEPLRERFARQNGRSVQPQTTPQSQILNVPPIPIETAFNHLLPDSFRVPRGPDDNAIEYRNVMIMGAQGSGKTTLAQVLALALGRKYGMSNVTFASQVAGVRELLNYATKQPSKAWILVGEDLTLARVPKEDLNQFFQVRHLIQQNTGLNQGLAITAFNSHTFHGIDKNLRDTFDLLILKSVPTNPYDRSILKRYFDSWLLDEYSRGWSIDKALAWSGRYPHGALATIGLPPPNAIENVTVKRSFWARLFDHRATSGQYRPAQRLTIGRARRGW
jgi:energy-coupling factor transporter ATP-binding protein EcfA2